MAHTIFLLHGMGNADQNWANPVMADIKARYAEYAISKTRPFDNSYELVPLFYNDVFEEYLKAWNDNAANLGQWSKLVAPPGNSFVKMMTQLAQQRAGDSFVIRYIGDVLLYMLTDIREVVKTRLLAQIAKKFEPGVADGWSMVCHSLGTRVMTDSFQALFTDPGLKARRVYGKAQVIMTVANVSRLLQSLAPAFGTGERGDVYHNVVFPGRTAGDGACDLYINTAHALDPFLLLFPFDPPGDFGDTAGAFDSTRYAKVQLAPQDLTGPNPHDFQQYLRHPDVHQALFQGLEAPGGASIFSDVEKKAARARYDDEVKKAALQALEDALQKLGTPAPAEFNKLMDIWKQFEQLVKQFENNNGNGGNP